jgi:hypothetical protein
MKKAVFVLALVTVGLLLAGCGRESVVQPPADQQELEVSFSTPQGNETEITITHAGGSVDVVARYAVWFYDVPDGLREYAIISSDWAGFVNAELHLLESKAPKN